MSKSLNVIALISGGKDSLYTVLHCIQNGHRVIALANLFPSLSEGAESDNIENEDINSFMYQTVGHSVIPSYEKALQTPLYRQPITGISSQTGRYYDSSLNGGASDETEDLVPLLERIKKHHPEADALCSGAILSTYQRTRIESVALRLGLMPLAYLWQYPILPPPSSRGDSLTGLLEDMHAAGCNARIIKIASGGMSEDLLGSNIADPKTMTRIVANMAPFFKDDELALRGAVLGEGGEFETLAFDGPRLIWKGKIEIMEQDNAVVSKEGGVKWLRLGQSRVVEQEASMKSKVTADLVRVPCTFDPQFEHIAAVHTSLLDDVAVTLQEATVISWGNRLPHESSRHLTIKLSLESHTLSIANIIASSLNGDAAQQMEEIVVNLKKTLLDISKANSFDPPLSAASIISTTLLLNSMSSFPSVNTSYARLFPVGLPNPPARVTIACSMSPNVLVSLSCIISLQPRSTYRGLHVQSWSYWAPANIGPYSQAICVPFNSDDNRCEFVHVAGQIPLVPASMEIFKAPSVDQALLALQHLWRIGQERNVDLWTWAVAFLPHLDGVEGMRLPHLAAKIWKQAHLTTVQGNSVSPEADDEDDDDESGVDAWDLGYSRMGTGHVIPTVGKHRHILPNVAALARLSDRSWTPPLIVAEVEALPRSAPVEWHSHGLGGLPKHPESAPRVAVKSQIFPWGAIGTCSYSDAWTDDSDEEYRPGAQNRRTNHCFLTVLVFEAAMIGKKVDIPSLSEVLEFVLPSKNEADGEGEGTHSTEKASTYVHGAGYISGACGETAFAALGGLEAMAGITLIPCRQLWGDCCQPSASNLGGDPAGLMDLSFALTLRIDSSRSKS